MIVKISLSDGATAPEYHSNGASGMDLRSVEEMICLAAGCRTRISTGISLEIPYGYEGQIRPRSSLACAGIDVPLGTIDSDYRGELMVIVANNSGSPFWIRNGDRIAQLVIAPVTRAKLQVVDADELSDTIRGAGGFGSTGAK